MIRALAACLALLVLPVAACAQEREAPPARGDARGGPCPEGYDALRAEDAEAAVAAFQDCLRARLHPWRTEAELRTRLGTAQLVQGEGEAALLTFNQIFALLADNDGDLDNPLLRRNRAAAYLQLRRYDEAIDDLETALSAGGGDAFTRSLYGSALLEAGRPAEAVAAFDEAVRLEPDFASGWTGRSAALIEMGLTGRAVEDAREAVQIAPESAGALNALCWALVNDERAAEGLDICDAALEADPDSGAITHSKAAALEQVGRIDEARDLFAKAYALEPDDPEIVADYERTREG